MISRQYPNQPCTIHVSSGWFAWPGDSSSANRWIHWFHSPGTHPTAENLHIDLYPEMDEYDNYDLMESKVMMKDGSRAKFFSSVRPKVVLKHFEWMRDYGITGAFHIRFMSKMSDPDVRERRTMVLRNVKNAAEETGRLFAVSYNIVGANPDGLMLEELKSDWMRLVEEEEITQSSQYIRQDGKPVLRIFGIGFDLVNISDTHQIVDLVNWLQNSASVYLIGGVPSQWRIGGKDARSDPDWKNIYDSLDGIQPWHVGRWKTINSFDDYYRKIISPDAEYCDSKGIL